MRKRVYLETFGCQMNKLDSELVLGELAQAGYEECADSDEADVILLNTCSVRQHAEEKVYSRLGTWRRRKQREPQVVIGVLGCMAQKEGQALIDRMPHVDLVCGTRMIQHIPRLLEKIEAGARPIVATEQNGIVHFDRNVERRPRRHAAYVAVMRGCDNYCSYCVVPYVRGAEVSRPLAEIVGEATRLACEGCKEITLLGQNVNSYGKNSQPKVDLADLLEALNEIDGLARIRFVTSHPRDMSDRILDAVGRLPKVCEHLHVPAQSGSDSILDRMKRGYTSAEYDDLIQRARERIADVTFSSDFIVGFPGETDRDFEATVSLVKRVEFQNCIIFKYSPRPGTAAARLADDVPADVKRQRNQTLLKTQEAVAVRRNRALHGSTLEVLVDGPSKKDSSRLSGRTRQNHIVVFRGSAGLTGRLVRVRVTDSTPLTLFGEIEHGG